MSSTPITWSSATSVTAGSNVISDDYSTANTVGFSATVTVSGTSGSGVLGNLFLLVSNDGVTYTFLPGSDQTVLVPNGASQQYVWSSPTFYQHVKLGWTVGSSGSGTLNTGTWSSVLQLPIAPPQPQLLAPIFGQFVPVGTATNPNPYGVDISCWDDLDPYFSLVGGVQALAQDLYHRVTTPTGALFYDPEYGFNSAGLLSQSITQAELATIQSNLVSQIEADQRVQAASVTLQFNQQTENLTVTAQVQPLNPQGNAQPFSFVASISAAGNNLLSVSPSLS